MERRVAIDRYLALTDFPTFLRALQAERGVSLRQIELRSGVDHTTIHRLISGRDPRLSTAMAIVDAFLR